MAVIEADSNKLISNAEELDRIIDKTSILIDELYKELNMINKKAWVSQRADSYVEKIRKEKENVDEVMNNIKKYSSHLKNAGHDINEIMRGWY